MPGTVRIGSGGRSPGEGRAGNQASKQASTRPGVDLPGRTGSSIIAGGKAGDSVRAGRVTPNQVDNFLSLPNRGGKADGIGRGADGVGRGNSPRGTQLTNASRTAIDSRISANNFRRLPTSQLNRINTNVNTSFRNTTNVNNSNDVNVRTT